MRDICENLIEENSKFNVYENEEKYFSNPVIYKNGVLRHNGTVLTEFISLQKIMQLDFELIEEPEEIDIQAIEYIDELNPYIGTTDKKINELIEAVKQLDRKIKEDK